jgi:DNA-binding GntR family transcriptional regulator
VKNDAQIEEFRSHLYAEILAKIISGEYPPGSRLVEEDLASAHDVSRTPIREVLFALERDGLVRRVKNQGAKVVAFTADDVEEIYEIRKALESLAVRRAVPNLKLNDLLEFERELEQLNSHKGPKWNDQQAEADFRLHRLIVRHSGNRRLISYLENISLLIHSLRLVGYREDRHARRAGEEHLGIVKALKARDARLAEELLASHIDTSKRNAIELFSRTDEIQKKNIRLNSLLEIS